MEKQSGYDLETIAHFKAILLAKRVEVMARIQRNGSPIFMEELLNGIERKDRPQTMELLDRHHSEIIGDQEQLRDIERSLRECEDGTYGLCPGCGMQILLARKEALPTASRCVPCQTKYKTSANLGSRTLSIKNSRRATA